MEFRRLTAAAGDTYQKALALYQSSFPLHEQREAGSQRAIMGADAYHFDLILDGGVWAGILLYWDAGDFLYVEHFAILPQLRGHRYGQRALELLRAKGKTIILEIDPPADDLSIRRKGFYERAGFAANPFGHIHPPYRADFAGHPLVVMSCPQALTQAEYTAFAHYLADVVMAGVPAAHRTGQATKAQA